MFTTIWVYPMQPRCTTLAAKIGAIIKHRHLTQVQASVR